MAKTFQGRIGVIGAGALGGFYGARLLRAGCDVHFLMRSDYDAVQRSGLKVLSYQGDFEVHPAVYATASDLGKCDMLLIGLKTIHNGDLAALLGPTVHQGTIVLTLQNGLGNEEQIAAVLEQKRCSREQIVGGVAFLCSNRTAPGVINHTDHGWIRIAEFCGAARERTRQIGATFEAAGISCEVHYSLSHIRWEKLVWNVPFNGLGVACEGTSTADILADEHLKACARALMEEVVAAAHCDGVGLPSNAPERMMKNTESMGEYRTSMQIDYENRHPLEVEAILGEPVRRALRAGCAVPRMQMLYALVRHLDQRNFAA